MKLKNIAFCTNCKDRTSFTNADGRRIKLGYCKGCYDTWKGNERAKSRWVNMPEKVLQRRAAEETRELWEGLMD